MAAAYRPTPATIRVVTALLGDLCTDDKDCTIPNSECSNGGCICSEGYAETSDRQECFGKFFPILFFLFFFHYIRVSILTKRGSILSLSLLTRSRRKREEASSSNFLRTKNRSSVSTFEKREQSVVETGEGEGKGRVVLFYFSSFFLLHSSENGSPFLAPLSNQEKNLIDPISS